MSENPHGPDIEWPPDIDPEERAKLAKIVHALDRAMTDFNADPKSIFPSNAIRQQLFYGSKRRWAKAWDSAGTCMFPTCTKRSLVRSHTIPMSASIKLIAEDGHVVAPQLTDRGVEALPIGIREASTFPGFCHEHEQTFFEFESQKEMTEGRHYILQAFRTLCRELFRMRHHKQKLESGLAEYRGLRKGFIAKRIREIAPLDQLEITEASFQDDEIETRVVEAVQLLTDDIAILERYYNQLSIDVIKGSTSSGISFVVATFDIQLPVCLSGIGVLNYSVDTHPQRALCLLAIIPEPGKTKIIYGSADEHMPALETLYRDQSSPAVLEMLESWMCHGSDHWFITPSEWAEISESRKAAALNLLLKF